MGLIDLIFRDEVIRLKDNFKQVSLRYFHHFLDEFMLIACIVLSRILYFGVSFHI